MIENAPIIRSDENELEAIHNPTPRAEVAANLVPRLAGTPSRARVLVERHVSDADERQLPERIDRAAVE